MLRDPELRDAYESLNRAYQESRERLEFEPVDFNLVVSTLLLLRALDKHRDDEARTLQHLLDQLKANMDTLQDALKGLHRK